MKTLIALFTSMLTPIRMYLFGFMALIVIFAISTGIFHERHVGAQKIIKADDKASAKVQKDADAGTEANIVKAALAARKAEDDKRAIDDYIAAHHLEPVRVCVNANANSIGVRQAGSVIATPAGSGARPAAVSQVLGGDVRAAADTGVDVTPAIDAILRATEHLDVLYRERQRR